MSKSENVAIYKYLTRPARPELPEAGSKRLEKVLPTATIIEEPKNYDYPMPTFEGLEDPRYIQTELANGGIVERGEFAKGSRLADQLPVKDYITIVKEMVADKNYVPPVNINRREVGRIPNFEKAKDIVKAEMGSGFTQAYDANVQRRKKLKQKAIREADPEKKAVYLAKAAERRRSGRIEKLGGDIKMTPDEKFLNFQQSLVTKQLNEKIRQNPDLILKNEALMDQLSTTVDKDGNIVKVKPSLTDIKNRGIFEIEHQRDIYKKGKMKDFPYNRNLILGPYNRTGGFKESAEKFIEKFPDPENPKVQAILNKADELGITIRPNVPEGTFPTKALGYKQAADPVKKFIDVATKVTPALASNDLGIPSYKGDIDMAKRALGVKELKSEFFPGSKATGEFISETASDLLTKGSRTKGLIKFLGGAGAAYGVYDAGVAFKEGKSAPEIAFRFVGADPIYNMIKEYNRLPKEAQAIQKKINKQQSFDAAQYDAMDEGLVGLTGRPDVTDEEKIYLDEQKKIVREKIQAEDAARAEGRMGPINMIKQKMFEVTGQPYEMSFANGGRVFLKEGGKPVNIGRRKFIKGTGQALTVLAALPFIGKFIKPATKAAPEVMEVISRSADQMPDYLANLINKIKMMGSSKIIGKMDSPDEFIRYDLGDYELFEGSGGARLKRVRDQGEYGYEEFEMQIKKDPETGGIEYDEVSVRPDPDGKMKDVEFGIEDDIHAEMKKFADED